MAEFEALENMIKETLAGVGLRLFSYSFTGQVMRVAIDKESGSINVTDCEQASRALEKLFDEREIINQHYTLEVSSPGLDRALKNQEDYARVIGSKVKIVINEDGKQLAVIGWLQQVSADGLTLEFKNKEIKKYLFTNIINGKIEVDFNRRT